MTTKEALTSLFYVLCSLLLIVVAMETNSRVRSVACYPPHRIFSDTYGTKNAGSPMTCRVVQLLHNDRSVYHNFETLSKLATWSAFRGDYQMQQKNLQKKYAHAILPSLHTRLRSSVDRAFPCGGKGRAFKSPRSRHLIFGKVAELVECTALEMRQGVTALVGSNPTLPATDLPQQSTKPVLFLFNRVYRKQDLY